MSRSGILQTDLGPELLEQVKREAQDAGLSASAFVRMVLKQRAAANGADTLSEKGGSKKATTRRRKTRASGR